MSIFLRCLFSFFPFRLQYSIKLFFTMNSKPLAVINSNGKQRKTEKYNERRRMRNFFTKKLNVPQVILSSV